MNLNYLRNADKKKEVENLTNEYLMRVNSGEIIPNFNERIHKEKINSAGFGNFDKEQRLKDYAHTINNKNEKLKQQKFDNEITQKQCSEIVLTPNAELTKGVEYCMQGNNYEVKQLGQFVEKTTRSATSVVTDSGTNSYNITTYTFDEGPVEVADSESGRYSKKIYSCPPPQETSGGRRTRRRKSRRPKRSRRRSNRKARKSRRRR